MKIYVATIRQKPHLHPYLPLIQTAEVEATTILEAIALILTRYEFVDIPEIIKIELVEA